MRQSRRRLLLAAAVLFFIVPRNWAQSQFVGGFRYLELVANNTRTGYFATANDTTAPATGAYARSLSAPSPVGQLTASQNTTFSSSGSSGVMTGATVSSGDLSYDGVGSSSLLADYSIAKTSKYRLTVRGQVVASNGPASSASRVEFGLGVPSGGSSYTPRNLRSSSLYITSSKVPSTVSGSADYTGILEPGTWRLVAYVLDVASESGTVNSSTRLDFDFQITEVVPVSITQQPSAATVSAGGDVTLSVIAGGDFLTYQWSKDGTPIPGATNLSLVLSKVQAAQAGSYTVAVTNLLGSVTSASAVVRVVTTGVAITTQPASQTLAAGGSATLAITATGDLLSYQWSKDGAVIAGATNATLALANVQAAQAGRYTVTVSNALGSVVSAGAEVRVATVRAAITAQPTGMVRFAGEPARLEVSATGDFIAYQWSKDGTAIAGATGATLALGAFDPAMAGRYTVTVTNALGSVTSEAATLATGTRLLNLSSRVGVETGGNLLICGLVVRGTTNRKVLIRAAGPRLADFGVPDVLADPTMILYDGAGKQIAANDDWAAGTAAATQEIGEAAQTVGAFPFKAGDKDAALSATLAPGSYTVHVRGAGDTRGVALMEVYDAAPASSDSTLVNLSTRALVGTGGSILIQGVSVQGGTKRLLVRAVGPRLGEFGVPDVLADPVVKIINSAGVVVAENDNWSAGSAATTQAITDAATASGAFPLVAGSRDAALVVNLPEGGYTVQVSGVAGGTGVALVEVYSL